MKDIFTKVLSKISKKYTFSLVSISTFFLSVYYVFKFLDYPVYEKLIITLALLLCILIISVTYLTGQAKIDVNINGKR